MSKKKKWRAYCKKCGKELFRATIYNLFGKNLKYWACNDFCKQEEIILKEV
jgi:hypothetical protein